MSDAGDKPAKAPKAKAPKQAAAEKEAKPGKQQAAAAKEGKAAPKKKADGAKAAPPPAEVAHDPNYVPRFKSHYLEVVRPELMKKFGYKNKLQAPRIEKIVLNIGAGEGAADQKKIQSAQNDLTAIAGQKAVITRAKKAAPKFCWIPTRNGYRNCTPLF